MRIRKTSLSELGSLLEIYRYARSFMAAHGNPTQWGESNWPPEQLLVEDIEQGHSYVCVTESGQLAGTFAYVYGSRIEPSYAQIYEGQWLDDSPYGVVHRLASSGLQHGVGVCCLNWAFEQCAHLRIDTHEDNLVMQQLLQGLGFKRCGIIYVPKDGSARLAYEKSSKIYNSL